MTSSMETQEAIRRQALEMQDSIKELQKFAEQARKKDAALKAAAARRPKAPVISSAIILSCRCLMRVLARRVSLFCSRHLRVPTPSKPSPVVKVTVQPLLQPLPSSVQAGRSPTQGFRSTAAAQ